mmetsp:Transcript_16435/g.18152  ORF Transcript_16435/g.18152 Transcript_16435/m.18152 type:complete len:102 (-) Transcript_16435:10-315(-)
MPAAPSEEKGGASTSQYNLRLLLRTTSSLMKKISWVTSLILRHKYKFVQRRKHVFSCILQIGYLLSTILLVYCSKEDMSMHVWVLYIALLKYFLDPGGIVH